MSCSYALHLGDCLEWLPTLPAQSVDLIATDIPYGTTACAWDTVIPFESMWKCIKHVLKPRGAFITTASQPFTSRLVMSNPEWFKYEWIWRKTMPFGFLHAKNAPLKTHENIVVFSSGMIAHASLSDNRMIYNPQFSKGTPFKKFNNIETKHKWSGMGRPSNHDYVEINDGVRYPTSILEYNNGNSDNDHPTQKPVALYEYLIRTYSNPGDLVCDFCMGSGTAGVAAIRTGRRFTGCELSPDYFAIAEKRIAQATLQPPLFTVDAPKPVQETFDV